MVQSLLGPRAPGLAPRRHHGTEGTPTRPTESKARHIRATWGNRTLDGGAAAYVVHEAVLEKPALALRIVDEVLQDVPRIARLQPEARTLRCTASTYSRSAALMASRSAALPWL